MDIPPDTEQVIKNTVGILFATGADMTVSTLNMFILAMALFPNTQKKVQAELHSVVGRAQLPYTVAVYKETMRWHPLVPFGIAHTSSEDDVIDGYFIPKGTIVMGNTWFVAFSFIFYEVMTVPNRTILHNEDDFGPNPERFNPDWFLDPSQLVHDPAMSGSFGYGRRICPGHFMAENSLFIIIASILQMSKISCPKDTAGNKELMEYDFISSFFSFPKEFKCNITPRSKEVEKLIISAASALSQ
ncbi:hypothetical protein M422DRAFT_184313 [Sphaerobolus stellatus SS14]|uniref:Cytochrome P450 n=1 Tax=Sphaerobolus stellatus (strain SS14) TaxID=990650 RepID=A0A0C9V572_SPHS4|nr:hypothetical protein M422DRAFT_184313 [Sphaerobolus stellatus SS14]